ncbi:serine protease [Tabrizicola sp.]|uniref:serine protease n=1 Tax=Tabrizicola sp. TaxID=2005166 RepID=UPI002869F969|nr:serine protease [Tabrizicola sp.]
MSKVVFAFVVFITSLFSLAVQAQDQVWVQIEAHPTRDVAEVRARAYAAVFPETVGYQLRSGWYAVALGPYPVAEGAAQLVALGREALIPDDSFIADGSDFREQFWPVSGTLPLPEPEPEIIATPDPLPEPALPDETRAEARASEASLSEDDRKLLQTALQWFGFYDSTIDGAFGPGTRNSMAAWQEAQAIEPTGVLTSRQRVALLSSYQSEIASFGFTLVNEAEAGIELILPLGLVEFDHYEPPFVHFRAKGGSGVSIVLISQPGDQASLFGLYDILQSLKAVPLTGERSRGEKSFRIRGTSATADTTAFAELSVGLIKGWMLISTPGNDTRDTRIIQAVEASFKSTGEQALDPGMVVLSPESKSGLLSGLEVRKPKFSRSGLFIDATGTVLTTLDAVTNCGRITIDRTEDATVTLSDAASGLAVITPKTPLSPRKVAEFQQAPDRIGAEVALAGYSYEDRLPSPVLTFGTLEDSTGLNGEQGVKRLSIDALPGDIGGPVLDSTGAVLGMLLPKDVLGGKQLPPEVSYAASADLIARTLGAAGLTPLKSTAQGAMAPEDLSEAAIGMTAIVSCWD